MIGTTLDRFEAKFRELRSWFQNHAPPSDGIADQASSRQRARRESPLRIGYHPGDVQGRTRTDLKKWS